MGPRDGGRNVLFVTLDQWRGDCLGAAGHPIVQTPVLDRLAASGVRFARHYANTSPCGPSRATLYTGLYAMNHRSVLNGTPLDRRFTNLALEARAVGYDPVLFGYTDTALDPRDLAPGDPRRTSYENVLPGFRAVLDFPYATLTPWIAWLDSLGYEIDPSDPHAIYRGVEPGAPARYAAEHSETAFVTDAVLAWLADEGSSGRPWFAHVSYMRPHPPFQAPAPYHAWFDPADVAPPRRAASRDAQAAQHPLAAMVLDLPGIAAPVDDDAMRRLQATYYGMVREVDDQLGRVMEWLDASGQADRTLVVVTSDHGEQMGDDWLMEKLGWWQASYHVPLIVRDPVAPVSAGRVVQAFTEHVDVLATIVEWIGGDVPVQADGRSLLAFTTPSSATLDGPVPAPADWRSEARWEWDFRSPSSHLAEDLLGITMEECGMNSLRDDRFQYVHFAADELPDLLFDLEADPDALHDLAADPGYASVLAEYRGRLLSWHMRHLDRTWTGTEVTPDGHAVRRDPRR